MEKATADWHGKAWSGSSRARKNEGHTPDRVSLILSTNALAEEGLRKQAALSVRKLQIVEEKDERGALVIEVRLRRAPRALGRRAAVLSIHGLEPPRPAALTSAAGK